MVSTDGYCIFFSHGVPPLNLQIACERYTYWRFLHLRGADLGDFIFKRASSKFVLDYLFDLSDCGIRDLCFSTGHPIP